MPQLNDKYLNMTFDDVLEEEYDKEHMGKFRRIPIHNNVVYIKCLDPYGFWYVTLEKGQVPDKLKGSYTAFDLAFRDVKVWLANKKEPYIPSLEENLAKKVKTEVTSGV